MELFERSFEIVGRMLMVTVPAMFVVQFLRAKGWLAFLDRYAMGIVRFTGFDKVIGEAFFASLGSAHASSGILMDLYRRGKLSFFGVILSSTYISLGPYIRIMVTLSLPAAFSLLPFKVAAGYIGFMLGNSILKSMSAGVLSHFFTIHTEPLEEEASEVSAKKKQRPIPGAEDPWRYALKSTFRVSSRAVLFAFFSSLAVAWLDSKGVFQAIPLDPGVFGLPDETLQVLAAWFAHLYAGMGLVGHMVMDGEMSALTAFQICVFCAIASRPIFFLKEAPGYYFGIYGPAMGLCLFAYHMGSLLVCGSVVLWAARFWGA